ncbi:MAG: UDP-N-acetylglucosamine 2-epimerase (non-hydrolyzing) [Thermanaerothrix sp.]|nr:UDP-N-acetylglucosamine 2-epimerase (non-hydrolyzing) [Thermanaerothrix sp.]
MKRKIVSLVGARPQFIKEAVVSAEVRKRNLWNHIVVHSGQHYDANMSDIFFSELEIPSPHYFLGATPGSHGKQTAEVLEKFESVLVKEKPDMVMVYGDTNTTVAGALAAAKLKIPVAHVEAGIRQKPKDMPEEINRVLTDHISTLLFCCSNLGVQNLLKEGISDGVALVGDIMYDLFLMMRHRFNPEETTRRFGIRHGDPFIIATIHRDFNTDNPDNLTAILKGLNMIHRELGLAVLLPMHPRTRSRVNQFGLQPYTEDLLVTDPVGYIDLMSLTMACTAVVTDSGGYQKEAYYAGKRAVVIMPDTGWRELVESGWNELCPTDPEALLDKISKINNNPLYPKGLLGEGNATHKILDHLKLNA